MRSAAPSSPRSAARATPPSPTTSASRRRSTRSPTTSSSTSTSHGSSRSPMGGSLLASAHNYPSPQRGEGGTHRASDGRVRGWFRFSLLLEDRTAEPPPHPTLSPRGRGKCLYRQAWAGRHDDRRSRQQDVEQKNHRPLQRAGDDVEQQRAVHVGGRHARPTV